MSFFNFINIFTANQKTIGSEESDLIIGSFGDDEVAANGGDDLVFGLFGNDLLSGGDGNDKVFGGFGDDTLQGGEGEDNLFGGEGEDRIVGNTGNDQMFGAAGDDLLVWNNGDGSDLMNGGTGYDRVQVNFDTDLVNDDLQNKDVAEISVTERGIQFARTEVNDQTVRGLFQLDIQETEALETNFGGGDDRAVIKGEVLAKIALDLDGGEGVDTLDLSQVADGVRVDLAAGTVAGSTADNFENAIGTESDDIIRGDAQDNVISGLGGVDRIGGRAGDDTLVGNKGDDFVFGGAGDDLLVWNNGDGSDLMHGEAGYDRLQVNFDTDLVNDDLQNKDVATFAVGEKGLEFARIEVNDQAVAGLFELDVRNVEVIETNFGGGDDTALINDNVLKRAVLDLDGGDGVDLLDLSGAAAGVIVDLENETIDTANGDGDTSTARGFEQVTGTAFDDAIIGDDQGNVIRGGAGNDIMIGGEGADTFVFFEEDAGFDIILDFNVEEDSLLFVTSDPDVTQDNLLANLTQVGDDVELTLENKVITFEDVAVTDFNADDFMIA